MVFYLHACKLPHIVPACGFAHEVHAEYNYAILSVCTCTVHALYLYLNQQCLIHFIAIVELNACKLSLIISGAAWLVTIFLTSFVVGALLWKVKQCKCNESIS